MPKCELCDSKESTKAVVALISKSGDTVVHFCDECFSIYQELDKLKWSFMLRSANVDNARIWYVTNVLTNKQYQIPELSLIEVKAGIIRVL